MIMIKLRFRLHIWMVGYSTLYCAYSIFYIPLHCIVFCFCSLFPIVDFLSCWRTYVEERVKAKSVYARERESLLFLVCV
jgi:hypothetical protein